MLLCHLLRIAGGTGHSDQHVPTETKGAIIPATARDTPNRQASPMRELISDQAARQRSVYYRKSICSLHGVDFRLRDQSVTAAAHVSLFFVVFNGRSLDRYAVTKNDAALKQAYLTPRLSNHEAVPLKPFHIKVAMRA
jgi:hypothetical protein